MNKAVVGIIYAAIMIAIIVTIDFTFLRDQPILRLIINIAIVAAAAFIYMRFIHKS